MDDVDVFDSDEGEESAAWACRACGGVVEPLGKLGIREHGRCRACGAETSRCDAAPEPVGSDDMARRATVETIVLGYAQAERSIIEACATIARSVDALNETLGTMGMSTRGVSFGQHHRGLRFDDPSNNVQDMRQQVWGTICDRLELKRMMSIKRAKELDEWLKSTNEPITVETVSGLFRTYAEQLPDMLAEAVSEVYNFLRPCNSEYKTNTEYELGEKVVLSGWLDTWWLSHGRCPQVSHWRSDHVRALDNVFSALDGKGQISKSWQGELGETIGKTPLGKGETTYFRFRTHKNGNIHLQFRRMDLVDKFNRIAGGRRLKHDSRARSQREDRRSEAAE